MLNGKAQLYLIAGVVAGVVLACTVRNVLQSGAFWLVPDLKEDVKLLSSQKENCLRSTEVVHVFNASHGHTAEAMPACVAKSALNLSLWWTIGPGEAAAAIVDEQADALRTSGLLQDLDSVNFWASDYVKFTVGSAKYSPADLPQQAWYQRLFGHHSDLLGKLWPVALSASAVRFWSARERTYEFPALEAAQQFCRTVGDPRRHAIAYIHTKASWHSTSYTQTQWRWMMQHFVLWRYRGCVRHLACGFHTCGPALYPGDSFAGSHYAGNFWWARCDYVRAAPDVRPSLEDLLSPVQGLGRWIAEGWLLGHALSVNRTSYHKSCWKAVWCNALLPDEAQEC
mmetsp:Transcript_54186/g.108821  ORF Transcript_54186/g.108821 Transcript_54186/m.108821 type:complete len:340 (-) Transcript_54186:38-1057(-)